MNQEEQCKNAFEVLSHDDNCVPTDEQKSLMLEHILEAGRQEQGHEAPEGWKKWIVTYPWRFAFAIASVQAIVCTLIFGTRYTNLFLNYFGG